MTGVQTCALPIYATGSSAMAISDKAPAIAKLIHQGERRRIANSELRGSLKATARQIATCVPSSTTRLGGKAK